MGDRNFSKEAEDATHFYRPPLRIVAAVEGGEHSLRELAELFTVDVSTIVRLLQRFSQHRICPTQKARRRVPNWTRRQSLAFSNWCVNSQMRRSRSCAADWVSLAAS
ncbi:MAG: hypothetical protein U0793_18990 [Gemmataceae bacterium]